MTATHKLKQQKTHKACAERHSGPDSANSRIRRAGVGKKGCPGGCLNLSKWVTRLGTQRTVRPQDWGSNSFSSFKKYLWSLSGPMSG